MNDIKKMCHNCLKWKALYEYKEHVKLSQVNTEPRGHNEKVYFNTCLDCMELLENQRETFTIGAYFSDDDQEPYIKEKPLHKSFECAFIGNTPYKQICKVFHIKHETIKHEENV